MTESLSVRGQTVNRSTRRCQGLCWQMCQRLWGLQEQHGLRELPTLQVHARKVLTL